MPVYFIAENENGNYGNLRVKIGISANVERRIGQLRTGSPYKLKLMGWIKPDDDRTLEKLLHQKYAPVNAHGEWFALDASNVFEELKRHSTSSFIATNENAFEIVSHDQDGVPEYLGSWQWGDAEIDEFCPSCGWGGGMDYNENYGGMRCLNCGLMESSL
ncbi:MULTISPECIES: GIY-YIG nuclease family protein [Halomonadaceae]|uniref:GIY-YIG nuclease family protein n=2 Tax=Vreelandella TaxID=3137766 RepID=A0A7Z0LVR2_9GAMM|nr:MULTISPECIES: GIY-YIG nuclease family protein [Halomonas]NYS79489.1 GIY-YIG nuclease family protein [Halomonas glaciei]|tara:strand:- start:280 stop:759 length:480 start_codon:yes stop_codon:yes gene_type:complete